MTESPVEGWPKFGPTAEEAHEQEGEQRLLKLNVISCGLGYLSFDRGHEEAVGGIDFSVPGKQNDRGGGRRRKRAARVRIGLTGVAEKLGGVAQFAGHTGPHIGGLGQAAASITAMRAQFGGSQQQRDGTRGIAPAEDSVGRRLDQTGDTLVSDDRALGQVQRLSIGLVRD